MSSSDLSFDLALERAVQGTTQVLPVSLISTGALWKYFVQATDLGTSWRSNSFDDAAWNSGPSMLGFGDANGILPATVVANNGQWTSYFRRSFVAPDPAVVQSLNARILREDTAVVYLNGAEVWRDENLPSTGTINYNTPAQAGLGGADESAWIPITIDTVYLQSGTNLIAIEVHQNSTNSSDLAMNFDLTAALLVPTRAHIFISATTLSWPSEAGALKLYSTTILASPVSWSPLSGSAYQSNGAWHLPLPAATTNAQWFYRLQSP